MPISKWPSTGWLAGWLVGFCDGEKGGLVVLKCSAAALQGAAVYLHPIQTTAAAAAVIHRSGLNSGGNVDVLNF
ncbi:hypothetical protein TYRP_017999 [Tyrophagus putrescentiae]|nr:hypothetical protein TYRP_017999 [Tyrophagus putrescentiae]